MKQVIRVAVTGAAGQIGYSLLFRLASGEVFGKDTQIELRLIEIEPAMKALEGVVMELEDCAFPLLKSVVATSDLRVGFEGANWCLLVGSVPRKEGMERKDLLSINGKIFVGQGKAIQEYAAEDVRILVVGNPCNTNCLIARASAPNIPDERWFAMTMLDENRAKAQIAKKAGVSVSEVSNLAIWGNHSSTQFPDAWNARIIPPGPLKGERGLLLSGASVSEVIADSDWLSNNFVQQVQQRGAEIIKARGFSSSASAANAVCETLKCLTTQSLSDDWFSAAVVSKGEYSVPKGLVFGYPLQSDGWSVRIVPGIEHGEFAQFKIAATIRELEEELVVVMGLGLLGGEGDGSNPVCGAMHEIAA